MAAAALDEVAFWMDESSASPDAEVVNALRPSMATVPEPLLIGISSPYARRGVLWEAWRRHYGKQSDVLVWQAPSQAMNPTLPDALVARALEEDEPRARAEFLAEFRSDVEGLLTREAVEAVVVSGRRELAPEPGVAYRAFVDPSGGSSDSMTLAIAHREKRIAVLDAIRERRPPFSPENVVEEFAALLAEYRVGRVSGDRYAGEWPRDAFRRNGIQYRVAESPKNHIYRDVVPAIHSKQLELLDEPRLVAQLVGLERRTSRGGRESIDHPPGGHDDLANAAIGDSLPVPRKSYAESSSRRYSPLSPL